MLVTGPGTRDHDLISLLRTTRTSRALAGDISTPAYLGKALEDELGYYSHIRETPRVHMDWGEGL